MARCDRKRGKPTIHYIEHLLSGTSGHRKRARGKDRILRPAPKTVDDGPLQYEAASRFGRTGQPGQALDRGIRIEGITTGLDGINVAVDELGKRIR
jgi:hypothetical protein